MVVWAPLAALVVMAGLAASGALRVRRYSGSHVVAHLAVRRRGLYFSRTPDGAWWRLRSRSCQRACEDRRDWPDPPPDSAVREPRRPFGPGPSAGCARADTPPL